MSPDLARGGPGLRVVLVSALDVVPEPVLFARLASLGALAPEARARAAVLLRDKALSARARLALGLRLREATSALGVRLLVADRIDLALALGADGAHLGEASISVADARAALGPSRLVSSACHAPERAAELAAEGADAVLLSPIFGSPGKGQALGLDALEAARRMLDAEAARTKERALLIALGGVDAERARLARRAGADAVAVLRADLGSTLAELLAT